MINLIFLLLIGHNHICTSQLSNRTNIHEVLNTKETKDSLNFVAVFLLTTLQGSKELQDYQGGPDFFQRVRASRQTWAYPVRHFYAVVGNNPENIKILSNTSICQNTTHRTRGHAKYQPLVNEEIFKCNGIQVIYLPYCDATSWGPKGPCCRCEGAMNYYLRLYSQVLDYPPWFMFSDDDYYTRIYKLQAMLSLVDPLKPYAVSGKTDYKVNAGPNKKVNRMVDMALSYHLNCTVPCTHYSGWLGYTVLSIGAMRIMESETRQRGLERTCDIWSTTHDVGLGIFVWYHAIPILPICCGANSMNTGNMEKGTYFHAVGKQKDKEGRLVLQNDMMQLIWEYGAQKRGENKPDISTFIKYEHQEGLQQSSPSFPSAGFENSLFYRKMQFAEVTMKQIPELQLKDISSLPMRRTDYRKEYCDAEMAFHLEWRRNNSDKYPLKPMPLEERGKRGSIENTVRDSPHEPKMCAEYWEAVANTLIKLKDLALPDLDLLERI